MLPTEKSKKKTNLSDFTILLYGLPKVGKSTTCARLDGAIFVPTEAGLNSLEVYQTPLIENWKQFLEVSAELAKGKHEFKTVVIDLVDNLYSMCAEDVCLKHDKPHESDFAYGKGYALIRVEFMRVINKLAALPTGLVLVSHSVEKEFETRTGKFTKVIPNLTNTIRASLIGVVDCVLFCDVEVVEGERIRVIRSKPHKDYEAGDRTGLFTDGMLLENLFKKSGGKK